MISDNTPDQLKLTFALWTRQAVQEIIQTKFGLRIPIRTVEEHPKKIEIFYLPSYSPELNPDEYLNCDLKAGVHSRPPSRTQEALITKVRSHMIKLQKLPARSLSDLG